MPEGLAYDLWLGPAPGAPFTPARVWAGTDRGLAVYDRKGRFWRLMAGIDGLSGVPVRGLKVAERGQARTLNATTDKGTVKVKLPAGQNR